MLLLCYFLFKDSQCFCINAGCLIALLQFYTRFHDHLESYHNFFTALTFLQIFHGTQ